MTNPWRSGDFPDPIWWADIPAQCGYFTRDSPVFTGHTPGQVMVRDEGSVHTIPVKTGNPIRGDEAGESHG
jgi:hypothetical protein